MIPLYILIAVVVSAVGGYYFTALVLKLAQRRSDKELAGGNKVPKTSDESLAASQAPVSSGGHAVVTDAMPEERQSDSSEFVKGSGPDDKAAKNALRGGMWIGILERVLITGFMLAGNTAGVAVVIAVKGLGRYPELNAATSERFIIGTLASLAWASLCAVIAGQLISELPL